MPRLMMNRWDGWQPCFNNTVPGGTATGCASEAKNSRRSFSNLRNTPLCLMREPKQNKIQQNKTPLKPTQTTKPHKTRCHQRARRAHSTQHNTLWSAQSTRCSIRTRANAWHRWSESPRTETAQPWPSCPSQTHHEAAVSHRLDGTATATL